MKKIILISVLMFSMILIFSCCKKDDPIPEPIVGLISLSELEGTWNFVSYQYNDKTYLTCIDVARDNEIKGSISILLSFDIDIDVPNTGGLNYCDVMDACNQTVPDYKLILDPYNIILGNKKNYIFRINSYNKTTKTLILKLLLSNVGGTVPINGIYTLQKI